MTDQAYGREVLGERTSPAIAAGYGGLIFFVLPLVACHRLCYRHVFREDNGGAGEPGGSPGVGPGCSESSTPLSMSRSEKEE
jgi:hypothetical protein